MSCRVAINAKLRAYVFRDVIHTTGSATGAVVVHDHDVIDEVVRLQRAISPLCLTVGRQCPHKFLLSEICWHVNAKDKAIPSGQKVRRLAAIRPARFDAILWTNRHIELFIPIPVQVAKK